jgi:hypothetical protein
MAWTAHKPANCMLGKQHKEEQKKNPRGQSLPLDAQLAATNEQAELMQWHYRLDHLGFPKLKHLALNGNNPKKPRLRHPSAPAASLAR